MKTQFVLVTLLVVFTLPAALSAQGADPVTVVNAVNDAWNAGDVDALKALYADDATVSFPDWGDVLIGREQIDAWIEGLAASAF